MKDIEKRVGFWSEADACRTEGMSMSHPFMPRLEVFESKDVLEIGPGWGRQYKKIGPLASTYCVADICQKVLDRDVYKDVDRVVIKDYQQDLNRKFDVITFWYVIHHILGSELDDFFDFLNRHLYIGGSVFFNCPSDNFDKNIGSPRDVNGDGIKTTPHGVKNIKDMLGKHQFEISYEKDISLDSYVLLAEKIGGQI